MSGYDFDVAIVGAGPTGLACGIELKRRNISSVLFDKGCVVNSLYNYPTNMVFFTTPELLEIGDIPMTSLNEKPGRTEALKYYRRVADLYDLNVHQYEKVERIDGDDGAFVIHSTDRHGHPQSYEVKKVILATVPLADLALGEPVRAACLTMATGHGLAPTVKAPNPWRPRCDLSRRGRNERRPDHLPMLSA